MYTEVQNSEEHSGLENHSVTEIREVDKITQREHGKWDGNRASDRTLGFTYFKEKEKRMRRIEDSLRDIWDNIKRKNMWIIGVPEEEEKKKGSEKIFEEIILLNFPSMGKEIVNQVQKHREYHTG